MTQRKTKKNIMKSGLVDAPSFPAVRYKARGKYKVVDGEQQLAIEPSTPENKTEDQVLTPTRRARLLDLTRNLVRNSSLFNTIIGQLTTNVVSVCGGKVVLSLPNEQTNKDLRKTFFSYTRNVDFYTGSSFNHLLKRTLREYVIGGDCVLLFDDGLIEDSGKILLFESNEIVDVSQSEVEKHYGKGAWCSQGKVYSPNGRHIGTIVSKSQKNCAIAGIAVDPTKCYYLKKDPNGNPLDNYWFHFSSNWREGRGVSQAASAISTIHQLEDLVQSELLASRRNSQIFCWLTQSEQQEEYVPSPFDNDKNPEDMTDDEIEEYVKEKEKEEKVISFNHARENAIVYEALPEGFDAKQLQMTHPNQNVQTMVDWLANRCAASMGLSKVFATGEAHDDDFRANQLFAFPAILELQKDLEQICDWAFYRFVKWCQRKGTLTAYVAEDFMDYVDWQWKSIDELDQVSHQTGIRLALENGTITYKELLGNDWKEKMKQTAYEHEWMSAHGITHPAEKLISGGETRASQIAVETKEEQTTEV